MEVCCSFKSIVGGICGSDSRDRKHEVRVVPLTSCRKDIANHLALFSFSGPMNEIDLILCRAAIFNIPDTLNEMTICPFHRGKLGLGWTSGSTRCRIPAELSNHGKGSKKVWPKGDRGLGKQGSEVVLEKTGVFIPAGSGKILLTFNFIYIIYKFAKYQFILFYMSWFIRNLQNMPQYRQEL
jgi:hypothetical protein